MLVTFLRHATAELYADSATDFDRALKKKGKEQVVKVADFCRKKALLPVVLCSSPAKRAQQTAQLLHTRLPDCPPVQTVDWLGLETNAAKLYSALKQLDASGVEDVWLVGHEPTISQTLASLLNAPGLGISIKKASLTRVQVDFSEPVAGQLLWSVPCALMC
jgi:phosphohistidine phosphatase